MSRDTTPVESGLINVPQRGYGVILTTTHEQFTGLYTEGATDCAIVTVTNQDRTSMVLAHIDQNTVLDDEQGLPYWINIIRQDIRNNDITILVSDSEDGVHLDRVTNIVNFIQPPVTVERIGTNRDLYVERGNNEIIMTPREEHNRLPIIPRNYTLRFAHGIENSADQSTDSSHLISQSTPPICIFDGNEFCGTRELDRVIGTQHNHSRSASEESDSIPSIVSGIKQDMLGYEKQDDSRSSSEISEDIPLVPSLTEQDMIGYAKQDDSRPPSEISSGNSKESEQEYSEDFEKSDDSISSNPEFLEASKMLQEGHVTSTTTINNVTAPRQQNPNLTTEQGHKK